ncbi:hypothetical protein B0H63DRAFT_474677 [Podospora didyma]|uniref:SnoaL-like domain-containing protein n=1 Tax=Podospora didyma TaxID=330526 RepID=A0AAE0NGC6_9PEZI|nr:hypothetical protein B0H63DRAFT_474677 [Podospora didyma]
MATITMSETSKKDLSSIRMDTIQTLLDGYSSLSVSQLLEPLSDNFRHHVLPSSLGMPERDKKDFAFCAAGIFAVFDEFAMVPEAVYEDTSAGVVVIHARMEGTLKSNRRSSMVRGQRAQSFGTKGKEKKADGEEWRNECVMVVRLSRDGRRVEEIQEFVDSARAVEMRKLHAPKDFVSGGPADGGISAVKVVGNVMLFSCLAAGTFYGVRRFLNN